MAEIIQISALRSQKKEGLGRIESVIREINDDFARNHLHSDISLSLSMVREGDNLIYSVNNDDVSYGGSLPVQHEMIRAYSKRAMAVLELEGDELALLKTHYNDMFQRIFLEIQGHEADSQEVSCFGLNQLNARFVLGARELFRLEVIPTIYHTSSGSFDAYRKYMQVLTGPCTPFPKSEKQKAL